VLDEIIYDAKLSDQTTAQFVYSFFLGSTPLLEPSFWLTGHVIAAISGLWVLRLLKKSLPKASPLEVTVAC